MCGPYIRHANPSDQVICSIWQSSSTQSLLSKETFVRVHKIVWLRIQNSCASFNASPQCQCSSELTWYACCEPLTKPIGIPTRQLDCQRYCQDWIEPTFVVAVWNARASSASFLRTSTASTHTSITLTTYCVHLQPKLHPGHRFGWTLVNRHIP